SDVNPGAVPPRLPLSRLTQGQVSSQNWPYQESPLHPGYVLASPEFSSFDSCTSILPCSKQSSLSTLQFQQLPLVLHSAAESRQASVASHHAMARHNNRNRILPIRQAN